MILGAHQSISRGYADAVELAVEDGCGCLQIFTKNQTQWKEPVIDARKIAAFRKARKDAGLAFVLSHSSYLINPASDNPVTRQRSLDALLHEMERCEKLGIDYLVMHPGAHMKQGESRGVALVAQALSEVLHSFRRARTKILLETTAGQGSSLGCSLRQLGRILKATRGGRRMGVCLDTCHVFAAGYNLRTVYGFKKTFAELDRHIGLKRLMAFHLNDSRKGLGSRVDRHEHLGKGRLGTEPFRRLMKARRFAKIPAVLETPAMPDSRGYAENLAFLRNLKGKKVSETFFVHEKT